VGKSEIGEDKALVNGRVEGILFLDVLVDEFEGMQDTQALFQIMLVLLEIFESGDWLAELHVEFYAIVIAN
jgi:hypothetical protein